MSGLNGVSPPIGGFTLEAGGCFTQAVTIAGVTLTGMTVTCSPRTPPPNGVTWEGYASNPNEVTLKICTSIAGFIPASIYDINVVAGGSGPTGFPAVVAAVNFTGQTGDLSFNLVATPPTGDYVLNDYLVVTTADPATNIQIGLSWADENGPQTISPIGAASGEGFVSIQGLLIGLDFPGILELSTSLSPPTVFHAVAGTPIAMAISVTGTAIASVVIFMHGLLYTAGDTVTIDGGNNDGVFTVDTVGVGGDVLTGHISTPGTDYSIGIFATTNLVVTNPAANGLRLTVSALLPPNAVYDYHATLVQNQ